MMTIALMVNLMASLISACAGAVAKQHCIARASEIRADIEFQTVIKVSTQLAMMLIQHTREITARVFACEKP